MSVYCCRVTFNGREWVKVVLCGTFMSGLDLECGILNITTKYTVFTQVDAVCLHYQIERNTIFFLFIIILILLIHILPTDFWFLSLFHICIPIVFNDLLGDNHFGNVQLLTLYIRRFISITCLEINDFSNLFCTFYLVVGSCSKWK